MAGLTDAHAIRRAQKLYGLLKREFGKRIVIGQQESPRRGFHGCELNWIEAVTGDLPALLGLDFIHDDFDGVTRRALDWDARGGIVSVCWHTGIDEIGYPASKDETPDWDRLFTDGTCERGRLYARWDAAAAALKTLMNENVPVLWRPFHEFDGQWFWWGKGGAEAFKRLWREMYSYYTDTLGIHNLIWVLGYADDVREGWNPGSEYFDVAGSDTYRSETAHKSGYERLKALFPDKPLCFHECGLLPPVSRFFDEGCAWSWVMPWHGRMVIDNGPERFKAAYADERALTLKRLERF